MTLQLESDQGTWRRGMSQSGNGVGSGQKDYSKVPPPQNGVSHSHNRSQNSNSSRNKKQQQQYQNKKAGVGSGNGQISTQQSTSTLVPVDEYPWVREVLKHLPGLKKSDNDVNQVESSRMKSSNSSVKANQSGGDSISNTKSNGKNDRSAQASKNSRQTGDTKQQAKSKSKSRRQIYADHLSIKECKQLKNLNKLQFGIIRINKRNRYNAYVTVDGYEQDFLVQGMLDRNRAFNGDTVAIEFLGEVERAELKKVRNASQFFVVNSKPKVNVAASGQKSEVDDTQRQFNPFPQSDDSPTVVRDTNVDHRVAPEANGGAQQDEVDIDLELDDISLDDDADSGLVRVGRVVGIISQRPGFLFSGIILQDDAGEQSSSSPQQNLPYSATATIEGVDESINEESSAVDEDDDDDVGDWEDLQSDDELIEEKGQKPNGKTAVDTKDGKSNNAKQKESQKRKVSGSQQFVRFKPSDNNCPLFTVKTEKIPQDYFTNRENYKDQLCVVRLVQWKESSTSPLAEFVKFIGHLGEVKAESTAILENHNINVRDFSSEVLKCLPSLPFVIPEEEIQGRRDLRLKRVFTIDPETAKDLDDAVSCETLPDGNLLVGVHIADVSHFIQPDSELDREALNRATTTYMVDRAYPMLPSVLCEDLCSLNPHVERLTFSVMWTMSQDAQIVDTWFGKSIIKSCAKLSYEKAQNIIDGQSWADATLSYPVEGGEQMQHAIMNDVKIFHKLSLILRKRRFDRGALTINQPKLTFRLDQDKNPVDCHVYQLKDSNRLIEEFMLLANMSVAQKISETYPNASLLRCHPPPNGRTMKEFMKFADKMQVSITASSAGDLQKSIQGISDPEKRAIFQLLAIKPMQRAVYFSTGQFADNRERWRHYALSCDLYTHFTSPIRRYADVVVHRQLMAAINDAQKPPISPTQVEQAAKRCNVKKEDARESQDDSLKLYLCVYLKNLCDKIGIVIEDAVVMDIGDHSIDVFIPKYAFNRKVYIEDFGVVQSRVNTAQTEIELTWPKLYKNLPPYSKRYDVKKFKVEKSSDGVLTVIDSQVESGLVQTLKILDRIRVKLNVEGKMPMDVKCYILHPDHVPSQKVENGDELSTVSQIAAEESVIDEVYEVQD
ncbi:hypothetical protein MP228_011583 [Amoeboaphelidium protococcarum]|nr:hypothetical protein MP228_011583 [Amoeboaphelidium protococcarum]